MKKTVLSKKAEHDASLELVEEIEAAMEAATIDNFDELCPNIENVEANDTQQEPTPSAFFAYHDLGPDIGLTTPPQNNDIEIVKNRLPERENIKLLSALNENKEIYSHTLFNLCHRNLKNNYVCSSQEVQVSESML